MVNEFRKNQRYERPTLFKGIHAFISVFSTFIAVSGEMRYYRGADGSLARPGRKQATATEDFDVHIP